MSAWDLVSSLAHQVHQPLDVEDTSGLRVHFEQGFYWIRFPYERTVVQWIKSIPAAQYLPAERLWCVPLVQYDPLRQFVEQARAHYEALDQSAQQIGAWCAQNHPNSTVRKAYTKDGASHEGRCLLVNAFYCVFSEGARTLRLHARSALVDAQTQQPFTPKERELYRIEYHNAVGHCSHLQEQAHA